MERVELRDPGPGEVRVRLLAAGVCHSDVGQADGEWAHPLPVVLGHEGCGVVESVGEGVSGVAVGQRVVLNLAPGCARCSSCLQGRPIFCQDALDAMGEGRLTTGPSPITGADGPIATYSLLGCFATHAVVAERSVIAVPPSVPPPIAALIGCAVITGVGAATETLDIRAGSRGAVVGVGGVGAAAIQGARLRGAAEIAAFDVSPERLEAARRAGATEAIDVRDEERLDGLRRSARRDGFDWAIVTVGRPEAIRLGVDLTRPGATTAVVGLTPESVETGIDMLDLVTFEKRIVGSAFGSISPALLMPRIARLYLERRLALDALPSEPLPLEAINEAFARSRRAEGGRPVLAISADDP
ncbi:MAG: alcohol dehydrogenase catalytic domain-containing protein, partial [Gaiellaceae bacterium]|nr:alcohol dehydrogenase catalytic domain-containing protein [Gaiellaceae bacterium]